jgi:fatty-acyl-CoA synthase
MQAHAAWAGADLSCLRMVTTGSTIVPHGLIEAFHRRGVPVGQVYGCTETAPIATYLRAEQARSHVGSVGLPALHSDVRVVDDEGHDVVDGERGEIWVRGDNVMREYWNDPEASAAAFSDGWFRTGDVAERGTDGFLSVVDRKRDMIISGSENVYPAEIERVLADAPAIGEVAVVGRADERWGEVAVAVVVRKDPALDADGVLALLDGRLARYKHPHDVIFVDALPRNAMGKVEKPVLRSMV